jgi:hypothetical protein
MVKTSRTYWLILVDRLNTKSMLRRRHLNIQDSDACVLCNTREVETIEHLFFDCPFTKDCWTAIHVDWDASFPLQDRFNQARLSSNLPLFTEATLIAAWELWELCNDKVFQRRTPTPALWLANFESQGLLQSVQFKDEIRTSFCVWLDAFS